MLVTLGFRMSIAIVFWDSLRGINQSFGERERTKTNANIHNGPQFEYRTIRLNSDNEPFIYEKCMLNSKLTLKQKF